LGSGYTCVGFAKEQAKIRRKLLQQLKLFKVLFDTKSSTVVTHGPG